MRIYLVILITLAILTISCNDYRKSSKENQSVSFSDTNKRTIIDEGVFSNCYSVNVKLLNKDSDFVDTILTLRNYQLKDSSRCIICKPNLNDSILEKSIFEFDFFENAWTRIQSPDSRIFAILDYQKINDSSTVATVYISDKIKLSTVNLESILFINGKIIGIKTFLQNDDQFIPIEEFDKTELLEE